MRNILSVVFVVSLLLGTYSTVLAQEERDSTLTTVTQGEEETRNYPARLEEAKKLFKDKLDAAKEKRVSNSCEAAQEKIAAVVNRTQDFQQRHSTAHQSWQTRLADLSASLRAAGVDTTTLDGYLQQLGLLISTNTGDFTQYLAGLENIGSLDCAEDPQAFYSELQTAKAARSLVINDLKEVISFIKDNIKAELLDIKLTLAMADNSDESLLVKPRSSTADENEEGDQ